VIGAFAPASATTISPQLVSIVNVRGIRFGSLSAGAIFAGVCPTAFVGLHLSAGTFCAFALFTFASAIEDGATKTEIAVVATINDISVLRMWL
jgi:hypothetical protein